MTKPRCIDLLVLIIYIILLVPLVLFFKVSFLVSTILFFVVPSAYLAVRGPLPWKRILYASFLFGFLLFLMDFLAEFNQAWIVPKLFFTHKIFSTVSVDILIWGFFWILFILIFYEHFLEHDRSNKISRRFKILGVALLVIFLVILAKFFVSPSKLSIPFIYLFLGVAASLLFLLIILKTKKPGILLHKFLLVCLFFAFVHLVHELTALKLGQWYFPGQYIGNVNILGIIFPIEEFFFWILISAGVTLSYYEYFVDDEK